jgi:hypothetical protein
MRSFLPLLGLLLLLAVVQPAEAQLRTDAPSAQSTAPRLYANTAQAEFLNRVFSPEHFRMSHGFEMSTGSFGSLGMYTNTMQWQFSDKLAARVDLAAAYSPRLGSQQGTGQDARFFLRNAEIAYRPAENVQMHFSFRQSPYGGFMNPHGMYGGALGYNTGAGLFGRAGYQGGTSGLFWRDAPAGR